MAIDFGGMAPLIQVFDMPEAIRFYRDVLGFEVVTDSGEGDAPQWVWLHRAGVDLMLNSAYEEDERPESPDGSRVQSHSGTCLYFACRDLEAMLAHLRQHGLTVTVMERDPEVTGRILEKLIG